MGIKESFADIQEVMLKIVGNKVYSEEFCNINSDEERFDYSKKICKDLNLKSEYTPEEFKKFDILIAIMHEITDNPELFDEFKKLDGIDKIYDFLNEKIKNYSDETSKINKDELKYFLQVVLNTKIPPDDLDTVSGGGYMDNYKYGLKLGQKLSLIWQIFKSQE